MHLRGHLRGDHCWALLLAGGEGSRLSPLTRNGTGRAIPKQFCSLVRGPSLLQATLRRAEGLTRRDRITAVVCEQHRIWWEEQLSALPASNIFVQPENRGTGIGILWPLLLLVLRDPDADVIILPTDHYFSDESVLADAALEARRHLITSPDEPILLGIQADRVEADLGWIVPSERRGMSSIRGVVDFVEKPDPETAKLLLQRGALWNSFILVARAQSLLSLFRARLPQVTSRLENRLQNAAARGQRLSLLADIPCVDFSRDLLQGAESRLHVLPVAASGWSDLGTPERLRSCLSGQAVGAEADGGSRQDLIPSKKLFCFAEFLSSAECV